MTEGPRAVVRAAFVVLAGGSGIRAGSTINKVYLPLHGKPVISWSLEWAARVPQVSRIVLVIRAGDETRAGHAIAAADLEGAEGVDVVHGGATRHGSEQAALDHLRPAIGREEIDVVVIHDGARPLAGARLLHEVIAAAWVHGGAVPTVPERHAWPVGPDGALLPEAPHANLHRVQTPQAFRAQALLDAYARAAAEGTDTAASMEARSDVTVVAVPGTADNLKVTYPGDLARATELPRPT